MPRPLSRTLHRLTLVVALAACLPALHPQQDPPSPADDFVRSHYTKFEFRIPMRDGKRLFTAVYVPKTSAFPADPGPYPMLMDRTPYSVAPYGEDQYPRALGPSDEFQKSGYIFVYQDVRGRWMSEGEFVEMHPHIDDKRSPQDVDDASDTHDTIDFLLRNVPNNNGKVGIWGISYPGFYTSASIIDSHPALVAASPQAPMTDLFLGDDSYHGGAFMLEANFGFYAFFHPQAEPQMPRQTAPFDFGTPDHYKFYLEAGSLSNLEKQYLKSSNWLFNDQFTHDTYDSYWQARDLSRHMKNVKCAVLVVGGWFDAEDLSGPYRTFYAINKFNPDTPTTLVEGPWVHGGWARNDGGHLGDVQFNAETSEYFREHVQFPFFEHYLKGKSAGAQPKAVVFETGANVWRQFDAWPPKEAAPKMLYFHAGGKLSFDPPTESKAVDQYLSDPDHPVPFVGYTTDTVPQRYMVDDQRFASYRPDVLVYQTDPLEEDVTIAGPISAKLKIASSGTDSDFVVKLIDVYPENYPDPQASTAGKRVVDTPPLHMGGYQQLLRGEPFRAKFRDSWEKPEPLTPGKLTELNFTMPDLFHTFRRGHRIMVQVQSSWFPLTDRNPQTFTDIPNAKPEDFKKATEQVFRGKEAPSGVEVLAMP
jgi:putative CocE/NonD family hydrolase